MGWHWSYGTKRRGYSAPAGPVSGFFMALVGLALLAGGAWTGKNTHELVTQGLHAEGRVAHISEEWRTKERTHNGYTEKYRELEYRYTVEFKDEKGAPVSFRDSMTDSGHRSRDVGDKVTVLYLERDPKGSATIDKGWMNWLLPGALGLIGVIFLAVGGTAAVRKPQPPAGGADQYKV